MDMMMESWSHRFIEIAKGKEKIWTGRVKVCKYVMKGVRITLFGDEYLRN
jgi:hypothetical protein